MKFVAPKKVRATRDVIASFPSYVAIDAEGLHCRSRFILVAAGEPGYSPLPYCEDLETADAVAMRYGAHRPASEAEREAAQIGSMIGWHVPGADPANYREE